MYYDSVTLTPFNVLNNPSSPSPVELALAMRTIEVRHYDFAGRIRTGHIVVHEYVVEDVRLFFRTAFLIKFPIHSVIPVKKFKWQDWASCAANNSSGHNMRMIDDTKRLSLHAIGCAIDINPRQNPCFVLDEHLVYQHTIPHDGVYIPGTPGTLMEGHQLVQLMMELGWDWGGGWEFPKDFQHFQKKRELLPSNLQSYVQIT